MKKYYGILKIRLYFSALSILNLCHVYVFTAVAVQAIKNFLHFFVKTKRVGKLKFYI